MANQVIADIKTKCTAEVSEGAKTQAIAEARLMRACAYFYMVRTWGPVIIIEDNQKMVDNPLPPALKVWSNQSKPAGTLRQKCLRSMRA